MDEERWEGQRWGAPRPRWSGDALTTLHPDKPGMDRWVHDPVYGWEPDCCDAHRPVERRAPEPKAAPVKKLTPDAAPSEEPSDDAPLRALLAELLRLLKVTR